MINQILENHKPAFDSDDPSACINCGIDPAMPSAIGETDCLYSWRRMYGRDIR